MFTKGQIVFSKQGRDKGNPFVVVCVNTDESRVYICDGKLHTLSKPKKKNFVHLQPTNTVDENILDKLENNAYLLDADIRKSLKNFCETN